MTTASTKQDRTVIVEAYKLLLALRHGASRARIQPALASLRDEIAMLDGATAEEVQTKFEAIVSGVDGQST